MDRILLNGILQFTHGSTRKNAELAIEFEKRQGKHICYESILQGALNSERVYGAPTVPLPYNTPLSPATMVYNVHTGSGDDLLKNVSNLSLNDQASLSPLLAHDRDEKSNKIVLEKDIEPLVQKIVENYHIKVKKDEKERNRSKERGRSENRRKDRKHSKRDKSQVNYSSTDGEQSE